MLDLIKIATKLQGLKAAARRKEFAVRQSDQSPHQTRADLMKRADEIEIACTIQNRCDTGIEGIKAIVELVGRDALNLEDNE